MMTREEWEQQVPEASSAILDLGKELGFHESAHPVNVVRAAWVALREAQLGRRVLWALQVLGEHDDRTGMRTRWEPFSGRRVSGPGEICPNDGIRYSGDSRAQASVVAARAVFRNLDAYTRTKLGECP